MSNEDEARKENTIRGLAGEYVALNSKIHADLDLEIIFTTEDKIKVSLYKYMSSIEKRNSWQAPLGILLTIIAAFSTTNFKEFIFPASTWQSLFIVIGLAAFVWLIWALKQYHSSISIDDLANEIKRTSKRHDNK